MLPLTSMPRNKSIEGFGFVYLEASYFELPIIANNVGGVKMPSLMVKLAF